MHGTPAAHDQSWSRNPESAASTLATAAPDTLDETGSDNEASSPVRYPAKHGVWRSWRSRVNSLSFVQRGVNLEPRARFQRGTSLEGVWERRMGGRRATRRRGESIIESMVIDMNEAQVRTVEQVRQVLEGTQAFEVPARRGRRGALPLDRRKRLAAAS
jgi:hypothetical protein